MRAKANSVGVYTGLTSPIDRLYYLLKSVGFYNVFLSLKT